MVFPRIFLKAIWDTKPHVAILVFKSRRRSHLLFSFCMTANKTRSCLQTWPSIRWNFWCKMSIDQTFRMGNRRTRHCFFCVWVCRYFESILRTNSFRNLPKLHFFPVFIIEIMLQSKTVMSTKWKKKLFMPLDRFSYAFCKTNLHIRFINRSHIRVVINYCQWFPNIFVGFVIFIFLLERNQVHAML